MYGYMGKILYVDLSEGALKDVPLSEADARRYIGGSGLGAKILYEEGVFSEDPLAPDNLLIFMTGPFAGTPVPTSCRYAVVARSPLTGIWGESDAGGSWAARLKGAGYDGLVIRGRAPRPAYVFLHDAGAEIRDASSLWGLDTYETYDRLREELGRDVEVSCIGQAGERMVKIASIMNDGKDARAAGRCGLGAVMGSKNLKAVAVQGSRVPEIAHPDRLKASLRELIPPLVAATKGLGRLGTSGGLPGIEAIGDLPIKNWREGSWPKGAEKICGDALANTYLSGRYFCKTCPIGCGRKVTMSDEVYGRVEGAGPEYETLAMLGSNLLIDDLRALVKANELCNRYGIDTISAGSLIAMLMEAAERGLLADPFLPGGVRIEWGSPRALLAAIEAIVNREGEGRYMAEGVRAFADRLGPGAREFAIESKGLDLPAHDPRAYNSLAVAYATSNRGACHLQGFTHVFERNVTMPDLGYTEVQDRHGVEGKGKFTKDLQDLMAIFDSVKLCKFTLLGGIRPKVIAEWLGAVTGWDIDHEMLMKTGERIYNLKRLYNIRLGVSRKDDALPPRVLTHRRGSGGSPHNLPPLNEMLAQYYEARGWDEFGRPKPEKLLELDLQS